MMNDDGGGSVERDTTGRDTTDLDTTDRDGGR